MDTRPNAHLAPARVLLVEDDDDLGELLRRLLARSPRIGSVERVGRLDEAIAALSTASRYDAVILDPGLPDAEGLEGLSRLRARDRNLPIVVLTASIDEVLGLEAIRAGADDYLVKGQIDASALARAVSYARERAAWREDRDRAAEREQRSNRLLTAIAGALGDYVRTGEPRPQFERMLTDLLALTGSEYGFIGEIRSDPDGSPYLQTHAITDISWNEESREFFRKHAPAGLQFRNLNTLFGVVITSRAPVIANDPPNDPRRGGLPPGHPPLRSFLGLPFGSCGQVLGMVGIANRPGGYDESIVALLEPLLATCATMVEAWTLERRRREMEAELAHARDEALESARLSAAILANMSHEIRTPLNVILGYTNLLDGQLAGRDEETRASLQSISRAGRRLTGLLQAILDLSRLEARALLPDPQPLDVEPLLRHLVDELAVLAAGKGLRLVLEPLGFRPIVRFDERSLQQILANLLQNAIKFTQSGEIRVRSKLTGDGALEIAVADTGVGIDRGFFARLFQPFAQEELGYTRRFEGAGLGLALVRRYAELNGATVEVESEKGKGSTFTVRVPPHLVTVVDPGPTPDRLEGAGPGR